MKLLYMGPFWPGSTSLQRMQAMARLPGVEVLPLDTRYEVSSSPSLWSRVRWRMRWPIDSLDENGRLLAEARARRPDVVVVENSKVIRTASLKALRGLGVGCLVYYTPDNVVAAHNLSHPLRRSFSTWDVFFTTKTFNVPELADRGVRNPVLVGKAYDPQLHRPLEPAEVGEDFERFDLVFIGTYERERHRSIERLAQAGFTVALYGSRWSDKALPAGVSVQGPVYHEDYVRCMHHGRLALCFLRKINLDRVTQRSMEIPAMGRAMVAERTDEHDAHFVDGQEYIGFSSDDELVARVAELLRDDRGRREVARAGRLRCERSGYSTDARARFMLDAIERGRARD